MGVYSIYDRAPPAKFDTPFKALKDWNEHRDRISELESLFPKKYAPLYEINTPTMPYRSEPVYFNTPLEKALGYNYSGTPIRPTPSYMRPLPRRPLKEMFEPNTHVPISRFTRDPWWWEYPELRPYEPHSRNWYTPSKFYLRDSYLSPVKRTYLWGHHPIRPLSHYY